MSRGVFLIAIGAKVRDEITGFTGIVTGRADDVSGCAQYMVQPPVGEKGGHVDARWYDEHRLSIIDASTHEAALVTQRQSAPLKKTGADGTAPVK